MRTPARGFTLVELLVAVVIFGLVTAAVSKVFNAQQRLAVAQVEQASVQSSVRNGSQIAASELWELNTNGTNSDILTFNAAGLTYRSMRTLGLACQISVNQVRIRTTPLYQYRNIVPLQDSLLLYAEGIPEISTDDQWKARRITAVTTGSTCGAAPAIALTIDDLDTAVTPLTSYIVDAPVRTFEVMEIGTVAVGAENWLGARSVSGGQATLVPVAGPIAANGLVFTYLDSLGAVTTVANRIRSIQIGLTGQSLRQVRTFRNSTVQRMRDSLTTTITLRNVPIP